jgi:hypothetical protein
MFNSSVLDVAVGLTLVYLLLSLACSAAGEMVASLWKIRASDLARGMRELLHDTNGTGMVQTIYNHPLIHSLFEGSYSPNTTRKLPSYIPARNFALALISSLEAPGTTRPAGFEKIEEALKCLRKEAGNDVAKLRESVELWFNSSMDRVSGWYKRRMQVILVVLGLVLAAAINADTLVLARRLAADEALRDALVAASQEYAKSAPAAGQEQKQAGDRLKENLAAIRGLGLPIGWNRSAAEAEAADSIPDSPGGWLLKAIGWLLTALAASLGAPFWFNVLNRLNVIRASVKPPAKEAEPKPAAA